MLRKVDPGEYFIAVVVTFIFIGVVAVLHEIFGDIIVWIIVGIFPLMAIIIYIVFPIYHWLNGRNPSQETRELEKWGKELANKKAETKPLSDTEYQLKKLDERKDEAVLDAYIKARNEKGRDLTMEEFDKIRIDAGNSFYWDNELEYERLRDEET